MTKLSTTKNCYLVRAISNPRLVLTVSGEFMLDSMCGPGGRCAKIYKTRRGAEKAGATGCTTVHPCTVQGVE